MVSPFPSEYRLSTSLLHLKSHVPSFSLSFSASSTLNRNREEASNEDPLQPIATSPALYHSDKKEVITEDYFFRSIKRREETWQDGVYGTNCPIPPGKNFIYILRAKDQIGSFFYFPSLAFHKAAGGFGGIKIFSRPRIPVPFPNPAGEHTVLAGDWFKKNQTILDTGNGMPFADGLLINGRGWNGYTFNVDHGKTYRFRISNVGLTTSINFRIQGHKLKLIEVEGSHTLQSTCSSLDINLGQSYSVLVTADQPVQDYYIAVSSRFTNTVLTTTAIVHYSSTDNPPPRIFQMLWTLIINIPLPEQTKIMATCVFLLVLMFFNEILSVEGRLLKTGKLDNNCWECNRKWKEQLESNGYCWSQSWCWQFHKKLSTMEQLANNANIVNGKQRYAVNGVSFVPADTPLKLADYYKIPDIFNFGSIPNKHPGDGRCDLKTSVMAADFRVYVEIVFEDWTDTVQSWYLFYLEFFWMNRMGQARWSPKSRRSCNLRDTVARSTTQVYPNSWTAIYMALIQRFTVSTLKWIAETMTV
ncbi:monocopper oxidase-like protein SKU5 [Telopea speciosissima]|uniref:monocopper oxidase-like protein SKU5 n=1 Tax=Telopea speciosissima TaxID=54955 RepID=UPI001CC7F06B|nr:monocopper oxidase-like protein SKU5 [Telopea speciosissima]